MLRLKLLLIGCIIILLLCSFKFNDSIYVNKGFYKGCYGTITARSTYFPDMYKVDLSCDGTLINNIRLHTGEMELSGRGAR